MSDTEDGQENIAFQDLDGETEPQSPTQDVTGQGQQDTGQNGEGTRGQSATDRLVSPGTTSRSSARSLARHRARSGTVSRASPRSIFVVSPSHRNVSTPQTKDSHGHALWFTPASPYTYRLQQPPDQIGSPSGVHIESLSNDENTHLLEKAIEDGVAIAGPPPVGHHGDFYWTEGDYGHSDEDYSDDDDGEGVLYEEPINFWTDRQTLFGRLQGELLPVPSERVTHKESRAQAKNGAKIADRITKVPLNKVWHHITEIWATMVFLTNVIVAIVDIVRGPQYLYYKVTALVLSVLENLVVVALWVVARTPWFKRLKDYKQKLKHFQIAENILHEVLLYPLLILTIVGFSTEKMYQKPGEAFGWTQLVLLILDVLELVIAQLTRLYMVYKFTRDIQKVLSPQDKPTCCGGPTFAGSVLSRAYVTIAGNVLLMMFLCAMLGVQVHKDNFTSSNYRCSVASGMLIICLIILPIFSIVLFVMANAYWILEVLIQLNLTVGIDSSFSDNFKDTYGDIVHGALEFAREKVPASKKRLHVIQSTHPARKILYGVIEIPIVILIFAYEVFLFLAIFMFDGFNNPTANIIMRIAFAILFLVANIHLVLLMVLSNISVVIILVSWIIYPVTVPICCKKRHIIMGRKYYNTS